MKLTLNHCKTVCPCKSCKKRYVGCHSNCEKYKEWANKCEKEKEKEYVRYIALDNCATQRKGKI